MASFFKEAFSITKNPIWRKSTWNSANSFFHVNARSPEHCTSKASVCVHAVKAVQSADMSVQADIYQRFASNATGRPGLSRKTRLQVRDSDQRRVDHEQ
jgi:hypothetical protein